MNRLGKHISIRLSAYHEFFFYQNQVAMSNCDENSERKNSEQKLCGCSCNRASVAS